ncbi:MAG: hypothetical protein HW421_2478 [Ignavibacteria bacterium]|nr:hypothetical protein [Ignavibacteria bacterium]
MILLDTHIWLWFVHNDKKLNNSLRQILYNNHVNGLYVSMISLWEVAKSVEKGKIILPLDLVNWFDKALVGSNINIMDLSREIIIKSTNLEGNFHKDPADQMITATSIFHDIPLATMDAKILNYPFVNTLEY